MFSCGCQCGCPDSSSFGSQSFSNNSSVFGSNLVSKPGMSLEFLRGASGRVAPGDCSPGAPTDPYVQDSRIRFLK
jgi:hypothetical protein